MLDAIKQWAFTLVLTAIVGGLAASFTISENGSMKKYVKFACSAVALAVMIMPIKGLFTEMPDMFNINITQTDEFAGRGDLDAPQIYLNELAISKTNELLKERISDIVYEKTGIKPGVVYIYIRQNDYTDVDIEKIIIDMPEDTDDNKIQETKLYLEQLFNCDVDTGEKIND